MKKILFKGNCTAIVTPFTKDNKINYNEFEKLIEYQLQNETNAIVFLGTTGEVATLTAKEKRNIIEFAVKVVNHRVPVIVGAGSNNTIDAIDKSKAYQKYDIDGLLHVTPYYNKATQEGLIAHFSAIAQSVDLPIILYNVPARTGVNITPQTVCELSHIRNIVGIKEASGNIEQIMEINRLCGNNISIYSGDDMLTYPSLSVGAIGGISVIGNIEPKLLSLMYKYYDDGQYEKSLFIHQSLMRLIKALFCQVNPIPVKYALSLYGFNVGNPRLPLTPLSAENRLKIKDIVNELND